MSEQTFGSGDRLYRITQASLAALAVVSFSVAADSIVNEGKITSWFAEPLTDLVGEEAFNLYDKVE